MHVDQDDVFRDREWVPVHPFFANGIKYKIHRIYPAASVHKNALRTPEGAWTIGVVRDPVDRILSLWQNKVVTYDVLDEGQITLTQDELDAGLTYRPDLNRFCMFLDRYRELSTNIKTHSENMTFHLGRELDRFDKIYNVKALEDLRKDLAEHVPTVPEMGLSNKTKNRVKVTDLDAEASAAIKERYKRDFRIFGKYF